MRTCVLEGCGRQHYSAGYCNPHWRRWKRNGDPGYSEINSPKPAGPCAFPGCERPRSCKGLCPSHYAQKRKGRPLSPINDRVPPTLRDDQGRKRCATCKRWLDLDQFRRNVRAPDGLQSNCRRCGRDRLVAARYGISLEGYERLVDKQDDRCAICGDVNASGRALGVDHDHECCPGNQSCGKCVRGLLCSNCNMAIGLLRDSPERLRAALVYVESCRVAG